MTCRLLFVLYLFALAACSQNEEAQYTRLGQQNAAPDPNTWVKADLLCEEIRNADDGDPLAVVYLRLLDQQHLLDTVYTCSVISPQMYVSYGIPRHALSASGGWWAGSGNFYYAMQEGDSIAVMQAQPIQGDSADFSYTLRRRLPATSSTPDYEDDLLMP